MKDLRDAERLIGSIRRGTPSASRAALVHELLQRHAHRFVIEQGHAEVTRHSSSPLITRGGYRDFPLQGGDDHCPGGLLRRRHIFAFGKHRLSYER